MKKRWLSGFLFFCLFVFANVVFADIVILKDGRRFEGKIVTFQKDHIVIAVNKGTYQARIPLKRSAILSIQKQLKTSWEELKEEYYRKRKPLLKNPSIAGWENLARWCKKRKLYNEAEKAFDESLQLRKKLAGKVNTPSVWFKLALWCKDKKFYKKARLLYRRVLDLDPDHRGAREALGYKKYKTGWLSQYEYEKKVEQDMRLKGYIKYRGKWYTAKALEALVKIKKLERGEKLKKLLELCNTLDKKITTMEKTMSQMTVVIRYLKKTVASQKTQMDSLYRRLLEVETVMKYWYDKYGYPYSTRNPWRK